MEGNREKISAVQRMQDYIMQNLNEEISLNDLAVAAHYSPWQALRVFSELTGVTPFVYIRDIRLMEAARQLRDTDLNVLDIALNSAFGSHEGFTKAFSRKFGLSPSKYRKELPVLPHFYFQSLKNQIETEKGKNMSANIVFTQVVERPARKLILKRGIKANEYFAYCEEGNCEVWDILINIKDALNEAMGIWLPEKMRIPNTSEYCHGVEVPVDFSGEIPEGFDIIELPPCKYMVFHGEPYEDDEKFSDAIGIVWDAISRYNPKHFGWEWVPDDAPRFQLAPIGYRGYIEGRPVREYKG